MQAYFRFPHSLSRAIKCLDDALTLLDSGSSLEYNGTLTVTGTETPSVVPTVEGHAALVVLMNQAATVLLISQDA